MTQGYSRACIADAEDGDVGTDVPETVSMTTSAKPCSFVATGVVANARLSPLVPTDWVDITNNKSIEGTREIIPDFLWENSPRHETKGIRDHVKVYSHLPNGINILDSKWVLGRIFAMSDDDKLGKNPFLATCITHCFSGLDGFKDFARSVELLDQSTSDSGYNNGVVDNIYSDPVSVSTQKHQHQYQHQHQLQQGKKLQLLEEIIQSLPDIAKGSNSSVPTIASIQRPPIDFMNWWVVKDAGANGAGGVWVVGHDNAETFGDSRDSPLLASHKYIAQQYVWPPVLYDGKKCHVRVYVTITHDGQAFVHRRAFLHVANDNFTVYNEDKSSNSGSFATFDDCVHITNCCANSHDDVKFAGEILADFGESEYTTWTSDDDKMYQQPVVPLAEFFPSVQASVSAVVEKTFRLGLLDGGEKNHGFEYCGMDFMLSYKEKEINENFNDNNSVNSHEPRLQPVAYLLEINSPPSQDTASSLPHAEHLHNEVLRDWMTCWVIPKIEPKYPIRTGGWQKCEVNQDEYYSKAASSERHGSNKEQQSCDLILPSKAALLNKIRWALFERKVQKNESLSLLENQRIPVGEPIFDTTVTGNNAFKNNVHSNEKGTLHRTDEKSDKEYDDYMNVLAIQFSKFARSQFPFFQNGTSSDRTQRQLQQQIFFENAGGAQVPKAVIDHVTASLMRRHRERIGSETKAAARETIRRLLVGGGEEKTDASSVVLLGLNATSLLKSLAEQYAKILTPADEVLVSTENHLANFDPWIMAAKVAGASIKLWAPFYEKQNSDAISSNLEDLVSPQTRVVAIPHASNLLGSIRPINDLCRMIKDRSRGHAHIVVDGVAVAPHEYVGFDENFGGNVDWYVVSMHKLFGPHIGVLLARRSQSVRELIETTNTSAPERFVKQETLQALIESGTANIEGCAGVVGLGMYFKSLSKWYKKQTLLPEDIAVAKISDVTSGVERTDEMVTSAEVKLVYSMIRKVEESLLKLIKQRLCHCPLLRIIDGSERDCELDGNYTGFISRLPTVAFVHKIIASRDIYNFCFERGIVCRHGFFLCTKHLASGLHVDGYQDGVLRVSLAHYNTPQEVEILCDTLENMPTWFGDQPSTHKHGSERTVLKSVLQQ